MAAKPVTLKIRDVALAAKAAYDEGRLSAQGPTPACKYRDPSGRPCAIGAALSDKDAARFDRRAESAVIGLIDRKALVADDPNAFSLLQSAHDLWAQGYRGEVAFRATLDGILRDTAEQSRG